MFRAIHRAYRVLYHVNRATRTVQALASGSPRRVARLYTRRAGYRLFARFINRVLR